MERFEVAIEVGPLAGPVIERLKAAGHAVYRGKRTWRVVVTAPVAGQNSVRAQAHVVAHDLVHDFSLPTLSNPPALAIRDPDAAVDTAMGDLLLEDVRRAYDPDPLERPQPTWWQRQMELGLGERKGR